MLPKIRNFTQVQIFAKLGHTGSSQDRRMLTISTGNVSVFSDPDNNADLSDKSRLQRQKAQSRKTFKFRKTRKDVSFLFLGPWVGSVAELSKAVDAIKKETQLSLSFEPRFLKAANR